MWAGFALMAQAADGSMRDGLSLLDQLIAFGGGKVDEEGARSMLGTIARDHVEKLAELLAAGDAPGVLQYAKSLEQWGPDYAQVLDELGSLLVRVATKQVVSDYESEELFAPELIEKLAKTMSPEDTQLFYQTAITGRRDLHLASEPRVGFEMTLLRMLVFKPAAMLRSPLRLRPAPARCRWRPGGLRRRWAAARAAARAPRRRLASRAQGGGVLSCRVLAQASERRAASRAMHRAAPMPQARNAAMLALQARRARVERSWCSRSGQRRAPR